MSESKRSDIDSLLFLAESYEECLPEKVPFEQLKFPLAKYLDCALHQPDVTPEMVESLCASAIQNQYASVFINPIYVTIAKKMLESSKVHVGTVVGFPLGGVPTEIKIEEARRYIDAGADEIDMVIAVGMLKAGEYRYVSDEIQHVTEVSHQHAGLVKVILEMALLNKYEKIVGTLLTQNAGADFVKTSTGFSKGGATVEDVDLIRRIVGPVENMGVKAAGGIHTLSDVMRMLKAGANRIGTRLAPKILREFQEAQSRK